MITYSYQTDKPERGWSDYGYILVRYMHPCSLDQDQYGSAFRIRIPVISDCNGFFNRNFDQKLTTQKAELQSRSNLVTRTFEEDLGQCNSYVYTLTLLHEHV